MIDFDVRNFRKLGRVRSLDVVQLAFVFKDLRDSVC